jgi:hypothetical protein
MRDTRVVYKHVETAELVPDALCRGDGCLIRDVELGGTRIRSDALRGCLSMPEVARPDDHGEAARCEILCDLKTDSFVGSGDKGDGFVLHSNLLLWINVYGNSTNPKLWIKRMSNSLPVTGAERAPEDRRGAPGLAARLKVRMNSRACGLTSSVERPAPAVTIGSIELTVTPRGPSSFAKTSTKKRGAILLPL